MESCINMKRPNKINVLGENIKIYWVKKPIIDQHGRQLAGFFDSVNRKIVIHISDNEKENQATLIHEAIHSVMFVVGLNQVISSELSEVICESMTRFIENNFKKK